MIVLYSLEKELNIIGIYVNKYGHRFEKRQNMWILQLHNIQKE